MRRLATPVALIGAMAVFAGIFAVTGSLLWSPALATAAAIGLYLMLDSRSGHQVRDDEYSDDAERKADQVLRTVKELRRLSRDVAAPSAKHQLQLACDYVPELLTRVRASAPNAVYSHASQLGAYLTSLTGVVTQYLDIQRNPTFYPDPATLLRGGEAAFERFTEFAVDSLRLINAGELAQYQANLQTVAPLKLPELG